MDINEVNNYGFTLAKWKRSKTQDLMATHLINLHMMYSINSAPMSLDQALEQNWLLHHKCEVDNFMSVHVPFQGGFLT